MAQEKRDYIRQSVRVDCPIEDAFRLFTEEFGQWWPLAAFSISGEPEYCAIEPWVGGRVFERARSGKEHVWGAVILWEPPHRLRFTWHPRKPHAGESIVDIEFCVEADGTRVTLIHQGWTNAGVESSESQACSRQWSAALRIQFPDFVCRRMLVVASPS